ncbi:DUF4177 domain-containing protein [Neobacillus notoginsengisoli]|uniref:DUF4177 domain-containing protein n=1 Tax=Neobacillus notoginsengisoli TaxID=1578198 RepID=A0A417YZJ0_9BACI|nr:DUF4177 domain-containing protein [Neobacillus notoginsengisoli]RHW43329.1 DUF4177 domain-containing protein [Neobacillus notoginsengisoli]
MDKWEYKTIKFKPGGFLGGKIDEEELETDFNKYGQEGWELVSCFDTSFGQGTSREVIAVMKRKIG